MTWFIRGGTRLDMTRFQQPKPGLCTGRMFRSALRHSEFSCLVSFWPKSWGITLGNEGAHPCLGLSISHGFTAAFMVLAKMELGLFWFVTQTDTFPALIVPYIHSAGFKGLILLWLKLAIKLSFSYKVEWEENWRIYIFIFNSKCCLDISVTSSFTILSCIL